MSAELNSCPTTWSVSQLSRPAVSHILSYGTVLVWVAGGTFTSILRMLGAGCRQSELDLCRARLFSVVQPVLDSRPVFFLGVFGGVSVLKCQ